MHLDGEWTRCWLWSLFLQWYGVRCEIFTGERASISVDFFTCNVVKCTYITCKRYDYTLDCSNQCNQICSGSLPIQYELLTCTTLLSPGAKVHQSTSGIRCIEPGGHYYTLEDVADVPEAMTSFLEHAKESLHKCKDIESAITGLNSGEAYFPVSVGGRPQSSTPAICSVSGGKQNGGQNGRQQLNGRCLSPGHKETHQHQNQLPASAQSSMTNLHKTVSSPSLVQYPDHIQVRVWCPMSKLRG